MLRLLAMKLAVKPITDKSELEKFISRPELRHYAKFYQTWEWGEVQASHGSKVERLGFYEGGALVAVGQLIGMHDRFGPYAYSPRGPLLDYSDHNLVRSVLRELIRYAATAMPDAICLRLDPAILHDSPEAEIFPELGFRRAGKFTQVERAWIIDIKDKSDDELLAWLKEHGMRSNIPRYLRRAERMGVTVRSSTDSKDLETFLTMISHLDNRKGGIGLLPKDYYRRQFAAMSASNYERIFIAEKDGRPLASAMIAFWGNEASYLHGASYHAERELHAPHYMHWHIMRYARELGCDKYNMWGVVKDENHRPGYRGYGFSEFKRSMGGYVELYMRTQEYPFKKLRYALAHLNDKRRLKRSQME